MIIGAGQRHPITLRFCPKTVGDLETGIKLTDAGNESKRVLTVKGTGFNDPIRFVDGNRPGERVVDIDLGQVPVGTEATYSLDLQNHTRYTSRFVIDGAALAKQGIKIFPTVGHVLSRRSKKIEFSVKPESDIAVAKTALSVKVCDVALVNEGLFKLGWDISRVEPEPEYEVLPKTDKTIPLAVSVKSGTRQFKCSQTTEIAFEPTLMYQTSVKTLTLSNPGKISFPFKLDVVGAELAKFFSVSPSTGEVNAGETREISVKFAPVEIYDYSKCGIVLTVPGCAQSPVNLAIVAKALRPVFHLNAPLDGQGRIVQVEALGVGMVTRKTFQLVNPTAESFKYSWEGSDSNAAFKIGTKHGEVSGGKKMEIDFTFTPTSFDKVETMMTFTIPARKISIPFKLIGLTSEPRLSTDLPCINFGKRLINNLAVSHTFNICNREAVPFTYQIEVGPNAVEEGLIVRPLRGVIEANGQAPVLVKFKPTAEKLYNFNLSIQIKWRKLPLYLNVKCQGLKNSN